jgi:hypothetical protein
MHEAIVMTVRIEVQPGNSRRYSVEFSLQADTRSQVAEHLAEVAETVKRYRVNASPAQCLRILHAPIKMKAVNLACDLARAVTIDGHHIRCRPWPRVTGDAAFPHETDAQPPLLLRDAETMHRSIDFRRDPRWFRGT